MENNTNDTETKIADKLQVLQNFIQRGASQESAKDLLNRISIRTGADGSKTYGVNNDDVLTQDLDILSERMMERMPSYFNVSSQQSSLDENLPLFALQSARDQRYPYNLNMRIYRRLRNQQGATFRQI